MQFFRCCYSFLYSDIVFSCFTEAIFISNTNKLEIYSLWNLSHMKCMIKCKVELYLTILNILITNKQNSVDVRYKVLKQLYGFFPPSGCKSNQNIQ